jgi:catechol 2,3-dioxygenase-like lactoylglutathione lyase family enzyme
VPQSVATVALVIREYDEALEFFTETLRFTVIEDRPLGAGKRWVVVATETSGISSNETTPR